MPDKPDKPDKLDEDHGSDRKERRRSDRRGRPLSAEEYHRRLDLLMDGVTVASELVRTSYRCLRVVGDLQHLYDTTHEPNSPFDFPWVRHTVTDITRHIENLETHIQIALTAVTTTNPGTNPDAS
jgi:hypothetical protein